MKSHPFKIRPGFTLLELVIVLAVLAVLAAMAVPYIGGVKENAAETATRATLEAVRSALSSPDGKNGYRQHVGALPDSLADLYAKPSALAGYDPVTRKGWNGPYLRDGVTVMTGGNQPAPADAWNRAIILQHPTVFSSLDERSQFARLVSPGADGVVQTPASSLYPAPAERGDDIVVFILRPDIAP